MLLFIFSFTWITIKNMTAKHPTSGRVIQGQGHKTDCQMKVFVPWNKHTKIWTLYFVYMSSQIIGKISFQTGR